MATHHVPVRNPLYGIGFMISMTICFSSLDASAKYVSTELPLPMLLWGRYLFHFLFVSLLFFRKASGAFFYTQKPILQIVRSMLIFGAAITFWGALRFLPLAECVVIAFVSPVLVTGLSILFLGERVGKHRWGVIVIGLLGVLIVIRPGTRIVHWASVLPLIAALFYANGQIITRILGRTEKAVTILFYTSIGGLILSSIMVLFVWVTPSPAQWVILIWLGFLGALGHFFMIKAFESAEVSLLAPFEYITLLWATLLGFFLFRDLPNAWTITGAGIIILSGLYLVRHERGSTGKR